ncbi:MAG: hypothetical protein ABFS42_03960 [Candidatus Krumholzibacteriota bacterium]
MKRIAIALVLVLLAAGAQAQSVHDMRTDLVPELTPVQVSNLIVTGFYSNGVFVSAAPFGEYDSIWVYLGSGLPAYPAIGDVIAVEGVFKMYYGLYEIDAALGQWQVTGTSALPAPIVVPAALLTDPATAAPYMCSLIHIPDTLYFSSLATYGEWFATAEDASEVMFDNFWYPTPLEEDLGACFDGATGCLNYTYSAYKLAAYEDGLPACVVGVEESSFGSVKSLFR